MTKLTIEKIDNGYILSWKEDWSSDDKEDIRITKKVIQENYEDDSEFKTGDIDKITLGHLLTAVAEHFGELYNKFAEDNLNITFDKKGHKL